MRCNVVLKALGITATLFMPLGQVVGLETWQNSWNGPSRVLRYAGMVDPEDASNVMRGSGSIEIGDGICTMRGSPRLYIYSQKNGWENVEMVAFGRYVSNGQIKSYSGLTFSARTNHQNYKQDPCSAAGYYARIYKNTGEASFQKEYVHSNSGTVYSASRRVSVPGFEKGLPNDKWIGMKFVVRTIPEIQEGHVELKLYLDTTTNGVGIPKWQLVHSFLDKPGLMPATKSIPSECSMRSGDTILGARQVNFIRTDGSSDTVVQWKGAQIKSLSDAPLQIPTAQNTPSPSLSLPFPPSNNPTRTPTVSQLECGKEWGQCGGNKWRGPFCCDSQMGLMCVAKNEWYSQCVRTNNRPTPFSAPSPPIKVPTASPPQPEVNATSKPSQTPTLSPTILMSTSGPTSTPSQSTTVKSKPPSLVPVPAPHVTVTCPILFEQCGGNNWQGPRCCAQGSVCTKSNEWYSQCLPDPSKTCQNIHEECNSSLECCPAYSCQARPGQSYSKCV